MSFFGMMSLEGDQNYCVGLLIRPIQIAIVQ